MTRYYSIKYSIATGNIDEFESHDGDGYAACYEGASLRRFEQIGRDCFTSPDEALAAFEVKRAKKLAALRKQLARLEAMQPRIGGAI